jgi:hypothetical protein
LRVAARLSRASAKETSGYTPNDNRFSLPFSWRCTGLFIGFVLGLGIFDLQQGHGDDALGHFGGDLIDMVRGLPQNRAQKVGAEADDIGQPKTKNPLLPLGEQRVSRRSGMILDNYMAERVRFELTVQHNCTPDFESGAFDHSATFPDSGLCFFSLAAARTEL